MTQRKGVAAKEHKPAEELHGGLRKGHVRQISLPEVSLLPAPMDHTDTLAE